MSWIDTYLPPVGATAPVVGAADQLSSAYRNAHDTLVRNADHINADERGYYMAQLTACNVHIDALTKLLPRYRNDASAADSTHKRLSDLRKLLLPIVTSHAQESWFNSSMPPLPTAVAEESTTPAEGVHASPPPTPLREPTLPSHPTPVGFNNTTTDASILAGRIRKLYKMWPAHVTLAELHDAGTALGYNKETTTQVIIMLSCENPPNATATVLSSTPNGDTNP